MGEDTLINSLEGFLEFLEAQQRRIAAIEVRPPPKEWQEAEARLRRKNAGPGIDGCEIEVRGGVTVVMGPKRRNADESNDWGGQ